MKITEKIIKGTLVLELEGDLMGGPVSETIGQIIDKAIEEEKTRVIIDMSRVNWMNSSGLGILISALSSLRSSGGDLYLANLNDRLKRPLQITKLDTVFKEFDSVEEAILTLN